MKGLSSLKAHLENCFRRGQEPPRIEVFVRHCNYSSVSQHKARFPSFSRERCYENFLHTLDKDFIHVTFLLDTFHTSFEEHFVLKQNRFPVVQIKEGTETGSFLRLLDYVEQLNLKPDTIVYFLEDDYVHREGWADILLEGFTLPNVDYVTLYDHKDKYFLPSYENLQSQIFYTHSCHWRTTPSTTNTYAMRFKTLKKHMDIHREFSQGRRITEDHAKFLKLGEMGATLISSIPGFATHAEPDYASPCTDWDKLLVPQTTT